MFFRKILEIIKVNILKPKNFLTISIEGLDPSIKNKSI